MLVRQKLPKDVLGRILRKFNLGQIKKIKPLETSGNITFLIESNKRKYLLRLSPSGQRWRSEEEINAELEIVNYLFANNFPVAEPVSMIDGKQIVSWENHFGYLRNFIDGDFKENPNLDEIKKFGELLGWFHSLIKNYQTKKLRTHIFDLEETKKNFNEDRSLILESNFPKKKIFVEKLEKELSVIEFPDDLSAGTIHEDLGKRHVLWKNDAIVSVLDFDRCYFGKLILDLGQSCRGWCFIDDWHQWSDENFKALITAYQNKRELIKLEKESLVNAIKFGVLERSLSFCLRCILVTKNKEDEKFAFESLFKLTDILEVKRKTINKVLGLD